MFWGLVLEGGKRFAQKVDEPFLVSMAALEVPVPEPDTVHSIFLEHKEQNYLLCSLSSGKGLLQVPLNIQLSPGSDVAFRVTGGSKKSKVHLTGFYLTALSPNEMSRSNTHSMITSTPKDPNIKPKSQSILVSEKKKADGLFKTKKKVSIQDESQNQFIASDDQNLSINGTSFGGPKPNLTYIGDELFEDGEDDDDDDDAEEEDDDEEKLNAFELDDDDEDEDDDESGSDEGEDEVDSDDDLIDEEESFVTESTKSDMKNKKSQKGKMEPGNKNNKTSGKVKDEPSTPESKKPKLDSSFKTPEQNSKISTPSSVGHTPMKFITKGGVMVQEQKVGSGGIPAKLGKMVNVHYVGRLKQNNKQFDSGTIKFRLGKGEVIKGWDIGIEGMKIGGKRRLIIPPQLAYGKRGCAPDIPPNSTLLFDVELKSVS